MKKKMKKSEKAQSAFRHLMKKMNLDTGSDFIMAGMVMEYIEQTEVQSEENNASAIEEITMNFTKSLEALEDERNTLEQKNVRCNEEILGLKEKVKKLNTMNQELREKLEQKVEDEFNGTFSSDEVIVEDFEEGF